MSLARTLAAASSVITGIRHDALQNGDAIYNTAVPSSSHVRPAAKWVLGPSTTGGTANESPDLQAAICKMTAVHLDTAGRTATAEKVSIELGVILVLGRAAAWQMLGLHAGSINPGEVQVLDAAAASAVVHPDHSDAVESAVATWSAFATRFVGIAWYNAVSFETHNHHHLPAKTGKLAKTTIGLLGMKEFFTAHAADEAESLVMHDMFHPLGYDVKAKLARNVEWSKALPNLNFGNLARRVPVKAPDCGLAFNYTELHRVASSYPQNANDIARELDPPVQLGISLAAYAASGDATAARQATEELRAMSGHFAVATAYLAGYILGKERKSAGEAEAEFADFKARITILGSPALVRATGEHSGAFSLGLEKARARVVGWGADTKVKATTDLVKAATAKAVAAREAVIAARAAAVPRPGAVAPVVPRPAVVP